MSARRPRRRSPHATAAFAAIAAAVSTLVLALAGTPAHAGRSCEARPPTPAAIGQAMTLAEHTAAALDRSGARVVVLARAGQNLDQWGLRYSHLGLAYRETNVAGGRSTWRVVHKLNQCGTAHAELYRQGLGDFFLDDMHDYRAGVVVLAPGVQERLLPVLRSNAQVARLDTAAYNMLAYPWSVTYQQSNQWAIETLALAEDSAAGTRERAQAWLKLQGYEPTALRITAMKRLGARLTAANIAFDDHPNEKRYADRIETVTVDSVFAWLERSRLGAAAQVVR
jgi:hypothetical protein